MNDNDNNNLHPFHTIIMSYLEPEQILYLIKNHDEYKDLFEKYGRLIKLHDFGCEELIDEDLKYLTNVHTLNLSYCKNLTEQGLFHLRNSSIVNLNLTGIDITNDSLIHLQNIPILSLKFCRKITDEGLIHLQKVKELDLSFTFITDTGLNHLENVEVLKIDCCNNVIGTGLKYLKHLNNLSINFTKIPESMLIEVLPIKLKMLDVSWTFNISEDYVRYLRNKNIKVFHEKY